MAQPFRVEDDGVVPYRGERVRGMLERVGAKRQECIELPDSGQPTWHSRARVQPPRLDGERELGAPEQERRERGEQLVPARIEVVDASSEAAYLFRRRLAIGDQRLLERNQQRRGKPFAFETLQKHR